MQSVEGKEMRFGRLKRHATCVSCLLVTSRLHEYENGLFVSGADVYGNQNVGVKRKIVARASTAAGEDEVNTKWTRAAHCFIVHCNPFRRETGVIQSDIVNANV